MKSNQVVKKKLIEVALPLEAINRESAKEKSIRHGHPSTLHLWWARRPLAACRAVIFGSLVDDPSSHPDKFPTMEAQEKERKRLFAIIERLVKWENSNNEHVLKEARDEILKSTNGNPPAVYDPFCGGGSIPLEAQRLGLKAYGSDLNPVAVFITKSLIEIPPKYAGKPPVNPQEMAKPIKMSWRGVQGLASDIKYYGQWMRDQAEKQIGNYYPRANLPKELGGGEATVIAWIWARTVKCPNPACGAEMPLVKSFWLSTKKSKQAWIQPLIDRANKKVTYTIRTGEGAAPAPSKVARGAKFRCLCCEQVAPDDHIKSEGMAGRMSAQLMAVVVDSKNGRCYLDPKHDPSQVEKIKKPTDLLEEKLPYEPRAIWCTSYGLTQYRDLYTARQLITLKSFSELISVVHEKIQSDAAVAGYDSDSQSLEDNGSGARAYADAISTYLAFCIDKCSDYWSSIATWAVSGEFIRGCFARQGIPMSWDYVECNPFSDATGNWNSALDWIVKVVEQLPATCEGSAMQLSATNIDTTIPKVFSTDPPYYDNIGYADLSDFFYVWLRKSLGRIYPKLCSTILVPKAEELIASPYRFEGNRQSAANFFEQGLGTVFANMKKAQIAEFPCTVFYAFKQSEEDESDSDELVESTIASTGWETMLEGLLKAGLTIDGTLPIRSERSVRSVAIGTNALASSIVLVCRPRGASSQMTTRREFINQLKQELPHALGCLRSANIAATDFAQAAIGPGMAIFSRYSQVMEADGSPMSVRTALTLINQILDEVNSESEGDFDPDSRWAVSWFETHGFEEGSYGEAETLSKAKNTSTSGLVEAGVITSKAGKVRLIPIESLPEDWNPKADSRLTVWEVTHHLIRTLETKGEDGAATLMKDVGAIGEVARDLAYRLYSICERKKWAKDALRYNGLIVAWSDVSKSASLIDGSPRQAQTSLF